MFERVLRFAESDHKTMTISRADVALLAQLGDIREEAEAAKLAEVCATCGRPLHEVTEDEFNGAGTLLPDGVDDDDVPF